MENFFLQRTGVNYLRDSWIIITSWCKTSQATNFYYLFICFVYFGFHLIRFWCYFVFWYYLSLYKSFSSWFLDLNPANWNVSIWSTTWSAIIKTIISMGNLDEVWKFRLTFVAFHVLFQPCWDVHYFG